MENSEITIHTLESGLSVIVEEMSDVESVAYELIIPGGIILDQPSNIGSSLILPEITSRGAGELNSRQLSDAFDALGIRHSESAGHDRFGYRGMLLGEDLDAALKLTALMILEPHLPEHEIDNIRNVLLQDIAALNDNPMRRVLVELSKRYYPGVYGRPGIGTAEGLLACTLPTIKADWQRRYAPQGSILSIAGKCSTKEVLKSVQKYFGAWKGKAESLPAFGAMPPHQSHHIQFEAAQLQIALAYSAAPFGHPQYFVAKVYSGILSGGMFGRLFTEVREKRGLVYSVFARHSSTKDYGTLLGYAGTTPERAQETLEVMVHELRAVKGTVTEEELARAKANLKASLVIGEESSAARASSNAQDWWLDRRVRTLDEIISQIDAVSRRDLDQYVDSFPSKTFMLVTLGSRELSTKEIT